MQSETHLNHSQTLDSRRDESMTSAKIFETQEDNLYYPGVQDVDPKEVHRQIKNVICIDVRQPEEFRGELGHIPGAKLIVLDTLDSNLDQVPKNQPVVLICRSGSRSARAAAFLMNEGWKQVFNMKGGMILWNELHLPTEI